MPAAPLIVGSAVFDARRPVIIVPVTAATSDALVKETGAALAAGAEVIEWRVDRLTDHTDVDATLEAAAAMADATGDVPVLATFRTAAEGADVEIDEDDYLRLLTALVDDGHIDLVDVEMDRAVARAAIAAARAAGVPTVVSYHDFRTTPAAKDLELRLSRMHLLQADVCKIAVTPGSPRDVLTVLDASVTHAESSTTPLLAIAMGPLGMVTRLHGGTFGSCATFATVGEASAPGQLTIGVTRSTLDLLALQHD